MNDDIHLQKYLKKNTLYKTKPHKVLDICNKFKFVINIPCFNEFEYIFKTLDSINGQCPNLLSQTLVVITINNSINECHYIKKNNSKTYEKLINKRYLYKFIVLDCFSNQNAFKDKLAGVGLARKVGLDFSLQFIKNLDSIFCLLDADTLIDKTYLKSINLKFKINNFNAAVINFKHQKSSNNIIEKGIRKYEDLLKEIALKIEKTGSPYGYVSMGSTIACNARTYISVGGMNIKKATEDFYFLQSIAKYTKVQKINKILVYPSSRAENRVYLGTGYRMDEYINNNGFKNLNYSDESYFEMSKILHIINLHWNDKTEFLIEELGNALNIKSMQFLTEKNIKEVLKKFKKNAKTKKQFLLFFNQWFDALTIMKFLKIHN